MKRRKRQLIPPLLMLGLVACQAPERPVSGFVWCEYYAAGRVYFSPVVPSRQPIRGRLCDGFAETIRESREEAGVGVLPDTLAYPTKRGAEERRQWHIALKRRNGMEIVAIDWRPLP